MKCFLCLQGWEKTCSESQQSTWSSQWTSAIIVRMFVCLSLSLHKEGSCGHPHTLNTWLSVTAAEWHWVRAVQEAMILGLGQWPRLSAHFHMQLPQLVHHNLGLGVWFWKGRQQYKTKDYSRRVQCLSQLFPQI
jgi:hypothetical protein